MKKISALIFILLFTLNCAIAQSLDEKIGQMLIVGFKGDTINSSGFKKTLKQIEKGEISGVLLFSRNIKSKKDLELMNKKILDANPLTPFISIDNEGGLIERYDFEHIKSAADISYLSEKEARKEYSKMAHLEKELKINFNFAPCTDLELEKESIIAKKQRSYGKDYKIVSKYARIFIEEHNKRNIITSIKHFPGHGSIKGDTHKGLVDATLTFQKDELMPYFELKDLNKLNTVMISHIYNSNFDSKYPASLSKKTIQDLLVDSIGFEGVIVSDDYDMGAIRKNYTLDEIIVNSINAGVNILIFSNNIEGYDKNLAKEFHRIVKKELKKGTIKIEDIDKSYEKIIELKKNLK